VSSDAALTVGADVVVTLAGLAPAAGVVKWSHEGTFGISFNRSLALPNLVTWLKDQQREQRSRAA
jgi:hypothetical protein